MGYLLFFIAKILQYIKQAQVLRCKQKKGGLNDTKTAYYINKYV